MSKKRPAREEIRQQHSRHMGDRQYHAMLETMCIGCGVESSSLQLGGNIIKIVRSATGIPVEVKAAAGENGEYVCSIPVSEIDFFEPTRECNYYEFCEEWMWEL